MEHLTEDEARDLAGVIGRIHESVSMVVKGKGEVISRALVGLVAEGHLLIEDVPGTGKTTLARALAASIGGTSKRIQFTPDLLPSDVTGVSIYKQHKQDFEFRKGAVFANIVVGDEINRASPKTQSALLEVMEERQVTVDAKTEKVPRPFMVLATQNPVEMDGTYPLPEAQLDRFMMRLSMGYPEHDAEVAILDAQDGAPSMDRVHPVISQDEALELVRNAQRVYANRGVKDYIVRLVAATRRDVPGIRLGVSPRGGVALLLASRAAALAAGRCYVCPDDVKALTESVLPHRLLVDETTGIGSPREIIRQVAASVPQPKPSTD